MKSFGPKSQVWLAQIGIQTPQDLQAYGIEQAYVDMKKLNPNITRNMLWGMLSVILDIPWNKLPLDLKEKSLQKVSELEKM